MNETLADLYRRRDEFQLDREDVEDQLKDLDHKGVIDPRNSDRILLNEDLEYLDFHIKKFTKMIEEQEQELS